MQSPLVVIIIFIFCFFALLSISTQSRVAAVAINLTRTAGNLRTPGSGTSYSSSCSNEEGTALIGFKEGTKKGVVKISVGSDDGALPTVRGFVGFSVRYNAWCSHLYSEPVSFWTADRTVQRVVTTTGDMRLNGSVDINAYVWSLTCSISTGDCYTCSSSSSSPGKVFRFNMETLAYNSQSDVITLSSSEIALKSAVISGDYLYVAGGSGDQGTTTKATVTKINLVTWQKVGLASGLLDSVDIRPWTLLADEAGEFLFLGCDTRPARITRIRISSFALEDAIEIAAASRGSRGMVMDAAGNIYLGGPFSVRVAVFGATTRPTFAPMTGSLSLDSGIFGPCIVQAGSSALLATWNQASEAAAGATVWKVNGLAPYSYTTTTSTTTTSSTTTVTSTTTTTSTSTSTTHPPTAPPRTQTTLPSRSESLTESENIGLSVTHLLPPTPSSSRSLARSNTSHRVSESSSLSHHPLSSTFHASASHTETKTPDLYFLQRAASLLESTGVSSAVALTAIIAMDPGGAVGLARLRSLLYLVQGCGISTERAAPDASASPLQLSIGDAHDDLSPLRGLAVGNSIFVVAFLGVYFIFGALFAWSLGRSFDKGKRMARAPGIVAIPILTLAADTASSISTLLTFGENTMRDLTAAVVGGSVLIVAPICVYIWLSVVTQDMEMEPVPGSAEHAAYLDSLKADVGRAEEEAMLAADDISEPERDEEQTPRQRVCVRASVANASSSAETRQSTLLVKIRLACAWALDPVSSQWVLTRFIEAHGKWFERTSSALYCLVDFLTTVVCGLAVGATDGPAPRSRCYNVAILACTIFALQVVLLAVWRPWLGRLRRLMSAVNGALALAMSILLVVQFEQEGGAASHGGDGGGALEGMRIVTMIAVVAGFVSLIVLVAVLVTARDLVKFILEKRAKRRKLAAAGFGAGGGRSTRTTTRRSFRLQDLHELEDDDGELLVAPVVRGKKKREKKDAARRRVTRASSGSSGNRNHSHNFPDL